MVSDSNIVKSEEITVSSGNESENDKSSSNNVTDKNNKNNINPVSTTFSSVTSQNSTEQLIKTKEENKRKSNKEKCVDGEKPKVSSDACSKSILTSLHSDSSTRGKKSRAILYLGMIQVVIGVAMVGCGGLVMVEGAALGKSGAGLWSGCVAVVTGVMGILGGINDCYGLYERKTSRMGNLFLTFFLGLSLISLAAGNLAAVLAGTGILRDFRKSQIEESEYFWPPILANIGLLAASAIHCIVSLFSIYHTAKRVCSCFRPREQFNHNQFDPSYSNLPAPYTVVSISENGKVKTVDETQVKDNRKELSKALENKLNCGSDTDTTDEAHRVSKSQGSQKSIPRKVSNEILESHCVGSYFGSANSKDKLVCSWLGGQPAYPVKVHSVPKNGMKKKIKVPIFLVPATAGNTLTRPVPVPLVPISAARLGYATLPMVPAGPPQQPQLIYPPHPPLFQPYPVNDMVRIKRKRYSGSSSPQTDVGRKRNNQLTRSLERIYRQRAEEEKDHPHQRRSKGKKKAKQITEADVIRTYTGLDRIIAEQFIAACDENRHSPACSTDNTTATNSSAFDSTSSRNSNAAKKK